MAERNLRNVAIIAHIDHGKTTLVDFLLKQSHTFRENEAAMTQELIMDSNDQERERGITILAKNTAITYKGTKINIIDTPGHADFGGEVERTLAMADGCILLVDAQEGPMPQTRVVLAKAFELGLSPIVVINKIDKPASRISEVEDEVGALFLELATKDSQLDYPILYAIGREGKSWKELPKDPSAPADLEPLFEKILEYVPAPKGDPILPFQLLITALDYDDFKGSYAIGKIENGTIKSGDSVVQISPDGKVEKRKVEKVFVWEGLKRKEVESAEAGDIIALTGLGKVRINETIANPEKPEALPGVAILEPTVQITLGPNTSPFGGREGKFLTARQIRERLEKELEVNVSLRVEYVGEKFLLYGRGELHLAVLFENLRREGFEFEVSKPAVVEKEENGKIVEPYEEVTIDVPEEYRGTIVTELAKRRANLTNTFPHGANVRFLYEMSTRSLLGLRNALVTLTRGSFVLSSRFLRFDKRGADLTKMRNGALIAHEGGKATAFGLDIAQGRGATFIGPGAEVYEGQIVGENAKLDDLEINVVKGKELTNMRSKSSDGLVQLAPPITLTLEQSLDFIEDDELLEITPESLRLRKKILTKAERQRGKKR